MQLDYKTLRLSLEELILEDSKFISELVNTPEWIKYIGDRNIKSDEDARAYIQRLIDNPNINYWVVRIQDQQIPIGIITFIKRNYLEHHDIGFAFLPQYAKQGFAYEAASAVLNELKNDTAHFQILATTIKENVNSIRLLEKLGFGFDREIKVEDETLLVYSIANN